jgi:hypothetical protein
VAERVDGDARGEVEVRVPVCVPEGGPLTLDEDDVWPGVGLEDVAAMRRGQVGEGRWREVVEVEKEREIGVVVEGKKNNAYRFSSSTMSFVNSSALLNPR